MLWFSKFENTLYILEILLTFCRICFPWNSRYDLVLMNMIMNSINAVVNKSVDNIDISWHRSSSMQSIFPSELLAEVIMVVLDFSLHALECSV